MLQSHAQNQLPGHPRNLRMISKKYRWCRGFTLAEMAIVVLIMGLTMTMGLKLLSAQLANAANAVTKTRQDTIKLALVSYLRSNGKLPCPDTTAAPTPPTGNEVAPCSANAPAGYGVVPWATLGLARETALDGWESYFTYRIANTKPAGKDWTIKVGAAPFDINELTAPTNAITIQELNATGTALVTVTTKAVVVIYSHGQNGLGARTIKGTVIAVPPPANLGEVTNNTSGPPNNGATFVVRPKNDTPTAFNGPYDDLVTYLTPQDLLQPLISEKTMKASCKSYCTGTCVIGTCNASNVPIGNSTPICACTIGETLP